MRDSTKRIMIFNIIAATLSVVLCGCGGGGGGSSSTGTTPRAIESPSATKSVRLNSYQAWHMVPSADHQNPTKLEEALQNLAHCDNVCITEVVEFANHEPGWSKVTPRTIKALNPSAKVYRVWTSLKPRQNGDNTTGSDILLTPLFWKDVENNDWWLRDADGDIISGPDGCMIDYGKPGVKEAFLKTALDRMQGKGFDGIVMEGYYPNLSWFLYGASFPKEYPNDDAWFEKAWKPFISYIVDGFHKAGYRVIINCGGEYNSGNAYKEWGRKIIDGVIYEQWAVDWPETGGKWLSPDTIAKRIDALANDPLEVWTADYGLRLSDPEYKRKAAVALAMYYVGIPQSQAKRSFHYYGDGTVFWDSLWNLYIGVPAEPYHRTTGKYFWTRKFSEGLVLLNYEESETISYTLTQTYHDVDGKTYSGTLKIPPHTGLILAAGE